MRAVTSVMARQSRRGARAKGHNPPSQAGSVEEGRNVRRKKRVAVLGRQAKSASV